MHHIAMMWRLMTHINVGAHERRSTVEVTAPVRLLSANSTGDHKH